MRSTARLSVALALVGLVVSACGAAATSSPAPTGTPTQAATSTPSPTAEATARPTVTKSPMTDGAGPEYVTGTDSALRVTQSGTETVVNGVTRVRDQQMQSLSTMNDPRVSGTSFITLNGDIHGIVMAEWGTVRLENPDGAWEGSWTGAAWNDGNATTVSGWLVGSGAYAGYTYYFHTYGESTPFATEGIIFEGSPPTTP